MNEDEAGLAWRVCCAPRGLASLESLESLAVFHRTHKHAWMRGGIIDSLSAGDHERAKASALLALASLDPWFSRLRQGTRLRTLLHVLAILPLLGLSARVDEQLRV